MAVKGFVAALLGLPFLVLAQIYDGDYEPAPSVTIKDKHITLGVTDLGYLVEFGGEGDLYGDGWGAAVSQKGRELEQQCTASFRFGGTANVVLERFDGKENDSKASSRVLCGSSKLMRIRHQFRSAKGRKNCKGAYEVKVTIENRGCKALDEVIYRRHSDFDIEGTENFFTFQGLKAKKPKVVIASNAISCDVTPDTPCTNENGVELPLKEEGPFDQGSVFEVSLGKLPKGKSLTFKMYYGYFAKPKDAMKCIKSARITTYSLASSVDKETTAMFGFRRGVSVFKTKGKKGKCVNWGKADNAGMKARIAAADERSYVAALRKKEEVGSHRK